MAVVASDREDPIARMRAFVSEKPEQLKAQLNAWTATQPAWVEGVVQGVAGSFQVRAGCAGRSAQLARTGACAEAAHAWSGAGTAAAAACIPGTSAHPRTQLQTLGSSAPRLLCRRAPSWE